MKRHFYRLIALSLVVVVTVSIMPASAWSQTVPSAAPTASAPPPPGDVPGSQEADAAVAATGASDPSPAPASTATPAPSQSITNALGLLPENLSPWGMFLGADIVVKTVICILAFASVLTWTVWLVKSLELVIARHRLRRALGHLRDAHSLVQAVDKLETGNGVAKVLLRAAQEEWHHSADAIDDRDGLKERVALHLERVEAATGRQMMVGTGVLATIGSTAPFVGLFGTVWGIMNSFVGISKLHTTNLAVVAPGIAEALLATAVGLVAAIPAVIIYNHFVRQIGAYNALVADAASAVMRLVSRDLSHGLRHDTAAARLRMVGE